MSTHCATGPNQVWCWDITWLPGPAKGVYYYLYLILDLYSRKVVGWEIHERESSELAACLLRKSCLREAIAGAPLVLHSDNGSPMKGASMMEALYRLGVVRSNSDRESAMIMHMQNPSSGPASIILAIRTRALLPCPRLEIGC